MLMTTKKILITGGLGYIGSKFLQRFNTEYNFKIVDSNFFGNHFQQNAIHTRENNEKDNCGTFGM